MKKFRSEHKRIPDINITPLIDVVFILLIFFMIGSTFEKPVMKVALPEAESGEPTDAKSIEVVINKDAKICADGIEYNIKELETFLRKAVSLNPLVFVTLSCDSELAFREFVSVMDVLNKAGVKNTAVKHEYPEKK